MKHDVAPNRRQRGPRARWLVAVSLPLILSAPARSSDESGPVPEHPHAAMESGGERRPLPLLPMMAEHQKANMRDHLAAVQEIVAALARDDMRGVGKAAGRIGYSEAMGQMCDHMGAAAPGFRELALAFHHTADSIADAAGRGDRAAVLAALGSTLQACVSCHATYRQEIVDDPTWRRLTSKDASDPSR